ncbi:uncharacterized protein B0H18DRAFT_1118191 [Fomitopsis serialis]|uniref:uncharacterized protein n=1 Tax=Fomitopsis serialis TaxID=139415 RepID=UPI0020085ADA|nr:uncharacterized protein B0H18DRAFT_1118191 [Neoantrodia serialis]KAH9928177.1 hypothetical protein B0H18DRAFT_1118191 [Neoantrodia serialis]
MAQTTANPAIFPSQRTHDSGVYAEPWSSFVPFSTNNAFDVANAADPGPSSDTIYGGNQHIVFPAPDSESTKLAEGQHSGTIWTDVGSASTRATSSTSSWRPQLDPLIWSESFVEDEKRRRTCKLHSYKTCTEPKTPDAPVRRETRQSDAEM